MSQTTRQLITEAFEDIGVLAPGNPLDETEATRALSKLTRIFDNWNAERAGVYAARLSTYALVPSLQPHTIGPAASTPTFTVAQRPVTIDWANIVIATVRYPLNIQDFAAMPTPYASISVPTVSTDIPTDLWYSADWPLGRIYLWPVPSAAYDIELLTRVVLADLALDDVVSLPPGYRDALTLTLGEKLAPSYPPAVADAGAAREARARIFGNNDSPPSLTSDYSNGQPNRSVWYYY